MEYAQNMLSLLTQSLGAGQWRWQLESDELETDSAFEQLFGKVKRRSKSGASSFVPSFIVSTCHVDDLSVVQESFSLAIREGSAVNVSYRMHNPCGQPMTRISCLALPEKDENSAVIAVRGVCYESKIEQLTHQVEVLESVLSHIPNQVFWKDLELNYLGCNNEFAKVVGLNASSDVVGKTDFDFQRNGEHVQKYRDDDRQVLESGMAKLDIQEPYHLSDGGQGHVLTSKVPLRDRHGVVYGILSMCTDITERVQVEQALSDISKLVREQKQLFEELVDLLPIMVNSFNESGQCLLWNRSCERQLGYSFEEARNTPNLMEYFYPDESIREQVFKDITATQGIFREYPVRIKNNDERRQLWANFRLSNGMMIGCGTDITDLKRTQSDLENQIRYSQSVVDNMPMGYHLWELNDNDQLVFKGFNRAAETILGFDHNPLIDSHLEAAFPALIDTEIPERMLYIAKNGGNFDYESLTYSDERIDSVFSSVYFQCYKGAVVSIFQDISALRIKEEELKLAVNKLKLVAEGSQDGFWHWVDPVQDHVEWSDNLFAMLGYEPLEFEPTFALFKTLLHPDDVERTMQVVESSIQKRKTFEIQHRLRNKEGEYAWFRSRGTPYYTSDGELKEMAGSVSDIDQNVKIRNSLKEAKEKAELATKSKSDFLSNMSHEIRTPMNAILGGLQLLESTSMDDSSKVILSNAAYSAKSLLTIINDILDYSKIEDNKLTLEQSAFSLSKVLDSVRYDLDALVSSKNINFITTIEPGFVDSWIGDVVRVKQIVLNLSSNAVKFTDAGEVRIELSQVIKCGKQAIKVNVIDSGIGMTQEAQSRIFERFSQADSSTTRKYGGTGLGMSITINLIKMMGGEINIYSEVGKGTRVEVILPLIEASDDSIPAVRKSLTAPSLLGKKILIAEDNAINQTLIRAMLQPTKADLTLVANGKLAVQAILDEQFDLVLMDIHMPEMDGVEAQQKIKVINHKLPVIALTANVMVEDVNKYLSLGFDSHIGKPIDVNTLYGVLGGYTDDKSN
ncbi:PAS domain-containing protein [Pseudoalteromonas luteoviolacea]|uniref:PAS domain-containing protein n=1 Tax=Pseudoalteromonas luteoviolacea TaxID=43657 RepID=UPI001153F37A|nr:PAS domain-containing protein [Pseudoalteromonas luteoviolacea]TQF68110.1 PAS domain S-box protein [Pseudoalteromonas luteoviolacea]